MNSNRNLNAKGSDAVAPATPMGLLRLGGNLLAAFLLGDAVMALAQPEKQTRLWSPDWSPQPWRPALRWLARHPQITRLLVLGQLAIGLLRPGRRRNGRQATRASATWGVYGCSLASTSSGWRSACSSTG